MFNPTEPQLEQFQTLPSDLLAQAARGEIDLKALARFVLAQRGQDSSGKWVGFRQAAEHHQIVV